MGKDMSNENIERCFNALKCLAFDLTYAGPAYDPVDMQHFWALVHMLVEAGGDLNRLARYAQAVAEANRPTRPLELPGASGAIYALLHRTLGELPDHCDFGPRTTEKPNA